MRRSLLMTPMVFALFVSASFMTESVLADNGRIEINQTVALAGGVTPGDTPGFPVTLSQPGSYVLTGSLVVPVVADGIRLDANDVTIDLNGFGIVGPVTCTGSSGNVNCVGVSGPFVGIGTIIVGAATANRVRVYGGNVYGFLNCIQLNRESHVDAVNVRDCDGGGIVVGGGLVTNSRVHQVGGIGIQGVLATFAKVRSNVVETTGGANFQFSRALGGNSCDDRTCAPRGEKRYYATTGGFTGSQALLACEQGYHFASLFEIADPTSLHYDSTRGVVRADSGSGPPAQIFGWVRTGQISNGNTVAGIGNCNAWTTDSSSSRGSAVTLDDWTAPASPASPWGDASALCNAALPVWCVED